MERILDLMLLGAGCSVAWSAAPLSDGRQLMGTIGTTIAAVAVAHVARRPS